MILIWRRARIGQVAADGLYRITADCRLVPPDVPQPADDGGWLSGVTYEDLGDGVRLNRFDFQAHHDHSIRVEGPSTLCLAIVIDGHGSLAIEDGPSLEVRPGVTVLFHAPHVVRGENRVAAGSRMRCLDFRFEPSLLAGLGMPTLSGLVRSFGSDCSVKDALLLAQPTSRATAAITREVLACRLAGPARQLYLRAKAFEALAHVLATVAVEDPAAVNLTRRDRDRVHHAAALLAERYDEPWTIATLARAAGLNERKLKAGFRAIVGRTVHAHLEESRLQAALRLLDHGATSVTDAALAVGYANPSHFAKLFRRRYGLLPRQWRTRQEHATEAASAQGPMPSVT
jgi:AraC-like DNA-binding protein